MKAIAIVSSAAIYAALVASASAVLFTTDFETDQTADWTVNLGPTDGAADFFFDYSTAGIPAAPSGAGTRGLKLQANQSSGVFGGMSASLTNHSLPSTYTLKFDWWANFNGPFPGGGSGSTQLSTFGVGTAGSTPQWPGGTQDSVWFGGTGDGGSSADWRAYSTAAPTSYLEPSGVYAAGTGTTARNNSDPFYSSFGSVTAPAAQLGFFSQQTGTTNVGSAGMEWHQVEIVKSLDTVTWTVDGVLIATVNATAVTFGGNNIFFGHSDINAGSSSDPNDVNLLFTLIDNVQAVPEPGTASVLGLTALVLLARRRR
ncbi:MAG: PEP-CTERM sorting domain-containing protein [Verrucomicrobiales bacterium]